MSEYPVFYGLELHLPESGISFGGCIFVIDSSGTLRRLLDVCRMRLIDFGSI